MQNKCNCGCGSGQGFVPADSNWDFSMNGGCAGRSTRRRGSQGCQQCGTYQAEPARESACQCERQTNCGACEDTRTAERCDQSAYIRDMDACPCGGENSRSRSGHCDDDRCHASAGARQGKNRTVGMVGIERQEIDEIFESRGALRAGTLFPELHKPLNGYCPKASDAGCATCQQASAFAAWEMRLYLNTHPNDKEALALFRKLCKEAEEENYATTFLMDDCCADAGRAPVWSWVKNPWPWEYDCQCRPGCGE